MQETFLLILMTSVWVIGIYQASQEEHILHGAKMFFEKVLGEKWSRPVLSCPYCMPSLHGLLISLVYHCYFGFSEQWHFYLFQWLFITAGASCLNYILYNLIRILVGYADLFEKNEEQ